MDYDSIIEKTKKELENFSSISTELEQLYKKAKEKNAAAYALAKDDVNDQYTEDKNAAVTKGMLDEKDIHEFLASRGLSSSGESVQAKLDSNVSINNALTELAKENKKALNTLEQKKLETDSMLNTELAEKKLDLDKWKTSLASDIAKAKINARASENANKPKEPEISTGKPSEPKKPAKSKETTQKTKNTNTEKPDNEKGFIPSTSAKELAKNIAASYAENGNIKTNLQKSHIKLYLDSLAKNEGVDKKYLKDVIINLKAAGYTDISASQAEAVITADKAKSYYENVYELMYKTFIKGNRSSAQASNLAKSKAKMLMLQYIYERCSTISDFERACKQAGVTNREINEYYTELKNINKNTSNSVVLGSKLNN